MKQTIAITGGTGKVGLPIIQGLLKAGYHVHVLVRVEPPPDHPLLRENISLTVMDLATLSDETIHQWLAVVRPLALIHLAALADVRACERQPALTYLLNVTSTQILARACAAHAVHCILLSTEYIFDGTLAPGLHYDERALAHPLNQYGKSKAWAERALQEECAQKTPWTICRTSMVYGSQHREKADFVQWVYSRLRQHEVVRIARDQINSPTASLDLARMLVAIVQQRLHGIYHVAGKTSISRYAFAQQIARHYSLDASLIQPLLTSQEETGPQRPLNASLCVDKITDATGIVPLSLEAGLALTRLNRPDLSKILSVTVPLHRLAVRPYWNVQHLSTSARTSALASSDRG